MSTSKQGVVEDDPVIVPPKRPAVHAHYRLDAYLVDDIEAIAERTGRNITETVEFLLRWAVERSKAEVEGLEQPPPARRKKPENQ